MAYEGPERRQYSEIPEELIEHIAERAAERVLNKVYQGIGRNVVRKTAWVVGLVIVSVTIFLAGKGIIKP